VDDIPFTDLSLEETERLASVFNANAEKEVALPLSKEAYAHICNETQKHAIHVAVNVLQNNFEEDSTMNNTTIFTNTDAAVKAAVNSATDAIAQATKNVRVRAGMDVESFKDKADESITTIKDATFSVLGVLDHLTGATTLKNSILHVLYKNTADRSSKRGFFDAADECRRIIYNYIDGIMEFDPDEEELRVVAALRYVVGEDENGKPIMGHRSIFSAFANGIVWIAKKVARKFRAWFGVDAETNIFGSIGASLASIFGMVAGVIGSVLKVALHTVIFVGSYVVSAVIKAVSFVWDKLKDFGTFMKTKFGKDDAQADAEDDEILQTENC
jgi:hypothetical protein